MKKLIVNYISLEFPVLKSSTAKYSSILVLFFPRKSGFVFRIQYIYFTSNVIYIYLD